MWRVVYMARSRESALKLEELLNSDGILVKIRPVSGKQGGKRWVL